VGPRKWQQQEEEKYEGSGKEEGETHREKQENNETGG